MDSINFSTEIGLRQLQSSSSITSKKDPVEQATPGEVLNSFGQILKNHLDEVNALDEQADKAVQTYAVGGPIELHQVMIAEERSDLAMDLTVQFRNKAIQAYEEINRMGI